MRLKSLEYLQIAAVVALETAFIASLIFHPFLRTQQSKGILEHFSAKLIIVYQFSALFLSLDCL